MADYITTYSKIHFTPLEPRQEDIKAEDIAHALSLMTRANGHFYEFYSVAQHCIYCCEEALARGHGRRTALACLLHDASEAYLADITRPVKKHLSDYQKIEEVLQNAIYHKYLDGLSEQEAKQVKEIDDSLLYFEFIYYVGEAVVENPSPLMSAPAFRIFPFGDMEKKYLGLFDQLINPPE